MLDPLIVNSKQVLIEEIKELRALLEEFDQAVDLFASDRCEACQKQTQTCDECGRALRALAKHRTRKSSIYLPKAPVLDEKVAKAIRESIPADELDEHDRIADMAKKLPENPFG